MDLAINWRRYLPDLIMWLIKIIAAGGMVAALSWWVVKNLTGISIWS